MILIAAAFTMLSLLIPQPPDVEVISHQDVTNYLWHYTVEGDTEAIEHITIDTGECMLTEVGLWYGDPSWVSLNIWAGSSYREWDLTMGHWWPWHAGDRFQLYLLTYEARRPGPGIMDIDGFSFPITMPTCQPHKLHHPLVYQ